MFRLFEKGPDRVSPFTIPKMMLNAAGGNVGIAYGLHGPNFAVATACASSNNAMGDALKAIQYDEADIMITGGPSGSNANRRGWLFEHEGFIHKERCPRESVATL